MSEYRTEVLEYQLLELCVQQIKRITVYEKNNIGTWKLFLVILSAYAKTQLGVDEYKSFDYAGIIFRKQLTFDMLCLFLNNSVVGELFESMEQVSDYEFEFTNLYDMIMCGVQKVKLDGDYKESIRREVINLYNLYYEAYPFGISLLIDYLGSELQDDCKCKSIIQDYMNSERECLAQPLSEHKRSLANNVVDVELNFYRSLDLFYKSVNDSDYKTLIEYYDIEEIFGMEG